MRDRDCRALADQEHRHRLADDVRPPDHHRVLAGDGPELLLQKIEAAEGRAGHERLQPGGEAAGVRWMKAVDVLGRIDRSDHGRRIDVRRKR
jgi:hypothetical protein